jgi:hypothetical protein
VSALTTVTQSLAPLAGSGMFIVTKRASRQEAARGEFELASGIVFFYAAGLLLIGTVLAVVLRRHMRGANIVVTSMTPVAAAAAAAAAADCDGDDARPLAASTVDCDTDRREERDALRRPTLSSEVEMQTLAVAVAVAAPSPTTADEQASDLATVSLI